MLCENCGKEHNGTYGSGRFCCQKCARGFSSKYVTEAGRKKQKEVLNNKINREKAHNSMMQNSKNYELNNEGRWQKVSKKPKTDKNKKDRHTIVTGKIGELATAQKFINHEYNVFIPLVDINGIDMIVEKDDGLKKVQVKTSSKSSNNDNRSTEFGLYTNSMVIKNGKVTNRKKKYDKDHVDYFALYSEIDNDVYLVENDGKHGSIIIRNSLDPSNITTKGKNLEKIHMAEDYQIDKVLDDIDKGIHQSDIVKVIDFIDKSDS